MGWGWGEREREGMKAESGCGWSPPSPRGVTAKWRGCFGSDRVPGRVGSGQCDVACCGPAGLLS